MARKTSARPRRGNSSKSTPAAGMQVRNLLAGIRSLHERLDELQSELDQAGFSTGAQEAAGEPGMVSLNFKKVKGPDDVRVTLMDTKEVILRPFMKERNSKPRAVGSTVTAKVEVNGGAEVSIDVTHASPSQLGGRGEFPLTILA